MQSINPTTGEPIREYPDHSDSEIQEILGKTQNAWLDWRSTSFDRRSRLMHAAADILRKKRETYARLMTLEMGKIIGEARSEVEKCAWVCDYYAENAATFLKDEVI